MASNAENVSIWWRHHVVENTEDSMSHMLRRGFEILHYRQRLLQRLKTRPSLTTQMTWHVIAAQDGNMIMIIYDMCKWSDTFWPVGRVRLFADYTISLSTLCRLIWRHWTTKMLVRYMMPSVCQRFRQFSQLSFIQYMGLCVFSLPNSPVMIVRMCTLSYHHHPTGSMNREPLFRVRSWNNGMRCMSYYVLISWHVTHHDPWRSSTHDISSVYVYRGNLICRKLYECCISDHSHAMTWTHFPHCLSFVWC